MSNRPEPPEVLLTERGRLINLGYRLLGSLADAEDAVQEAYARWYGLAPEQQAAIASPGAWLNTVTSRICLDVLGSARVRREQYVGEWIPEPVPDTAEWSGTAHADPADRITLDESVDMAFLVVLDSMTPAERVAFLLHDVFRYPFDEVAEIVGRSSAACRQLASSARRRVRDAQPIAVPSAERARVVRGFKEAWQAKDVAALIGLLDPAAAAIADGGGLVAASLHPVEGGAEIARYLVGLAERAGSLDLLERTVNGQPGLVARAGRATVAVYAFEIADDRIQRIWVVRNPEKLRTWREL
ncbi:RNA polymerase sigma factor SigJ [Nocardioides marmoriginsengisoli]|uniref:RNA polymerase sigma factor SigJ n=1 Tax=Nocardioides marmoriginsengisoli TaxID=661483 RepID=A0A3N0CLG4_9ACTN|nr:RNA polymerase sigma factor SigJ [Nocardioides marmoriginsengisoli]RNL64305.1 RNA polymerase sigma factor SigJ [Nocardioides marmoriginsengisoli]